MSGHVSRVCIHGVHLLYSGVPVLQCWLMRKATRASHWRTCMSACSSTPISAQTGLWARLSAGHYFAEYS